MKEAHENRAHALLSASGASRWLNCTPSARIEEKYPDKGSSIYAKEGTLAHELAEAMLRRRLNLITAVEFGKIEENIKSSALYSEDMPDEVIKYVDFCMEQYLEAKKRSSAIALVEERSDFSMYVPEGFGTGDFAVIADKILDLTDLKYGMGVKVYAEENPQLMLYGLGILEKYLLSYDIEIVRLNIVQPRLDHISSWSVSVKELIAWGAKISINAFKAFNGEGLKKSGSWCKWCKAAPECRTLMEETLATAKVDFDGENMAGHKPDTLTKAELVAIYKNIGVISDWISTVKSHVLDQALEGVKFEGLKLVEGKSNRVFTDKDKVISKLSDLGFTPAQILDVKLKGITAIEKLLGKKEFGETLKSVVIKPEGKPTLVDSQDPRPELGIEQAKEDFKN